MCFHKWGIEVTYSKWKRVVQYIPILSYTLAFQGGEVSMEVL